MGSDDPFRNKDPVVMQIYWQNTWRKRNVKQNI